MTVRKIIEDVVREFQGIPGVVGIVLGGSRAGGTHRPDSDIDIGVYYDESRGFNVRDIGKIATQIDDEHREGLITALAEWGEWINGGGWLEVQGYHVDIIFRDIKRVSQVIADCLSGFVSVNLTDLDVSAINDSYYNPEKRAFILNSSVKRDRPFYTEGNSWGTNLGKVTKNSDGTVTAVLVL